MIGIFNLWQAFLGEVNTHQGGFWSPVQNFTRAVNDIQRELMQEKFAKWQENQKLTDDIYPFLLTANITVPRSPNTPYDIASFPTDYCHYSAMRVRVAAGKGCGCKIGIDGKPAVDIDGASGCPVECDADNKYIDPDEVELAKIQAEDSITEGMVRIIDNQRFSAALQSQRKGPRLDSPLVSMYAGGFRVAPKNIGIIVLDYFRMPKDAVFNYTLGPNDEIQFVSTGSVDLEWPATIQPEFKARLLKMYAVFTGQTDLYQIGQAEQQLTSK